MASECAEMMLGTGMELCGYSGHGNYANRVMNGEELGYNVTISLVYQGNPAVVTVQNLTVNLAT